MRSLRRSDPDYRHLLAGEAVLVFGESVEDCNAQALSLLRCKRDDIVGHPVERCVPPVQSDGTVSSEGLRLRIEAARTGLQQWFPWQLQCADGAPVETLVHLEVIELDGQSRSLVRLTDLSRLRHAERALQEAESRLQQILEHSPTVVFVKDMEGRYLFVNQRFREMFPASERAGAATRDADVFSAEVVERLRAIDRRVLEARSPIEIEEDLVVAGKECTYLVVKFPLLDDKGKPYAVCGIATDITARKRTERALRSAALAVSSAEGEVVFQELTRYLATTLGVDGAFVAQCTSADAGSVRTLAVYTGEGFEDNIEYALSGTVCGTVVGKEFRFIPSSVRQLFPHDRMFRRLSIQGYAAYPLTDSSGRPLGLIAVMSRRPMGNPALTESMLKIFAARAAAEMERKRVEEARRISEASYRSIFEAAEDAIFIHDWDTGAIVDVNPKACHAYGYSCEEMRRLTVADISSGAHPYTEEEAGRLMAQAKLSGPIRFEWHRKNRDGTLHWDEVCLKPAVIAGEKRIVAFTREITERKHAEEGLRASEEQYRAIFDASVDGLAVLDARGLIVDVNPAYVTLFGYPREELVGTSPTRLLALESQLACRDLVSSVGDGRPFHRECRALRRNGEPFDVEIRGAQMHYQGQPHLLAIVRDITARKRAEAEREQLEAQLLQAQKMEAIGHLTGGIAHDFNNILTSIMGYIVLGQERQGRTGDPKVRKYLEQANVAASRARDLIQQMLTFSRGQRGEPRPLSLPPLISESVKLLRSTLPSSIEIETEVDGDVPAVLLDPVQVEQVLLNLCINARDAMRSAGTIRVSLRTVPDLGESCASCRKPVRGRMVELAVRDTGSGIAPEVMDRMFEPFFSTKEVGKGSGMGLSTVHGIVHEHGGHILVDTALGRGTSFRILFDPLADDRGARKQRTRKRRAARGIPRLTGRVLVVDDEQMVGQFMSDLLENWGLEVVVKTSPIEARTAFEADPARFDLVVTDQTMPRITGVELAQQLLAVPPGCP